MIYLDKKQIKKLNSVLVSLVSNILNSYSLIKLKNRLVNGLIRLPLFLICFPNTSFAHAFFDEHAQGWFWYEEGLQVQKPENKNSPSIFLSPTQQMKVYQRQVEDSLNLAILNPSEANLKAYAKNYFETIKKAQHFTDAYQLMVLKNPSLDYSLKFPTSPLAQRIYAKQKEDRLQIAIQEFARTHGFFFFFSPLCQYCHLFAPIVKEFSEKYGIAVLAINLDPKSHPDLKEFPNALPDKGAARLFKITYLPSLFVVNPKTREVIPIANGFINLEQLEENLKRIIEAKSSSLNNSALEVLYD